MIHFKKHFLILFLIIIAQNYNYAQSWNLNIEVLQDTFNVYVESNEQNAPITMFFEDNLINESNTIILTEADKVVMNNTQDSFTYKVYNPLNNDVTKRSIIDYGEIKLLNLNNLLFTTNSDLNLKLKINIKYKDVFYDFGENYINEWKSNPIVLSNDSTSLIINNIVFNTNQPQIKELVASTFSNFKYLDEKEMYVISSNEGLQNSLSTFNDISVVYLDSNATLTSKQNMLLKSAYYWLSPYKIYPEQDAKKLDQNWLVYATPEYLSLKYMLSHQLITEKQFFSIIEKKIKLAENFSGKSIYDMSIGIYNNPNYNEAFITKGVVALWILDLEIYRYSKGKISYFDLISGKFPEMNEEESLAFNNLLFDLNESLVNSKEKYNYNNYLKNIGLVYQEYLNENKAKGNLVVNEKASSQSLELWKLYKGKKD